jgi:hypothetical protein
VKNKTPVITEQNWAQIRAQILYEVVPQIHAKMAIPTPCSKCGSMHPRGEMKLIKHLVSCVECFDGLESERKKIMRHLSMDELVQRDKSLNLESWLETLSYYRYKCAYCLTNDYEELEHFIPRDHGGRTNVDNCVPACKRCNGLKGSIHPDDCDRVPGLERIGNIRLYLSTRKKVFH